MIASPLPAATTPVAAPTAAHNATATAEAGEPHQAGGFARLLDQALEEPADPPAPGGEAAADTHKAARARTQRAAVQPRLAPPTDAQPATAAAASAEKTLAETGAGDETAAADAAAAHEPPAPDATALLASLAALARPTPAPETPAGRSGRATSGQGHEDLPHGGPALPRQLHAAARAVAEAAAAGADDSAAAPAEAAARSAAAALPADPHAAAEQTAGSGQRGFAAELQAALQAAPATATAATRDNTVPSTEPAARSQLAASPDSPAFAPELGARLATFIRDGVHHARLELHPAQMGPLTVQIQLDGQAAQVHLAAQNADTRQALEQAMPQLAGSLREAGLTLSGGGVFEQPRQPQQDAPAGRHRNAADSERDHNDERGSKAEAAAPRPRRGVVDLVA